MSRNSIAVALRMIPSIIQRHSLRIGPAAILLPPQTRPRRVQFPRAPSLYLPPALLLTAIIVILAIGIVVVDFRLCRCHHSGRQHFLTERHRSAADLLVVHHNFAGQRRRDQQTLVRRRRPLEMAKGERWRRQ